MKTVQTKTCISTYDGDFFDYENPEGYEFDIDVIAHALSNLCRFNGHSRKFYSVAEHSVLVSRLLPNRLALTGLLHDASEAFCGDVASPLKRLLPDYQRIEDRVQRAICSNYNLPYPFPEEIHLADKQIYKAEREQITTADDKCWHVDIPAAKVMITGMPPKDAKQFFLHRYRELTGQYSDRDKQVRRQKEACAKAA